MAAGRGISTGEELGKHRRVTATVPWQGPGCTHGNKQSLTQEVSAGENLVWAAHAAIACEGFQQAAAAQRGPGAAATRGSSPTHRPAEPTGLSPATFPAALGTLLPAPGQAGM